MTATGTRTRPKRMLRKLSGVKTADLLRQFGISTNFSSPRRCRRNQNLEPASIGESRNAESVEQEYRDFHTGHNKENPYIGIFKWPELPSAICTSPPFVSEAPRIVPHVPDRTDGPAPLARAQLPKLLCEQSLSIFCKLSQACRPGLAGERSSNQIEA
jgi:hypothetical protein